MFGELYAVLWQATWGNNLAWLESLAATAVAVYLFRDRLGRRAAAWWHRHHAPHIRAELAAALERKENDDAGPGAAAE